jgi:hypothetical protein
MRHILAVDPGKASGLSYFVWEGPNVEPEMLWSMEVQQHEYADPIRKAFAFSQSRGARLEVVCERFTINAQTVRNSQAPYSLEQIGILKQIMMDYGRAPDDIYFQSPADAKAMFSNEKIKILDYWHRGGEGHALDSIRHGLLRLVKSGWKPLKLLK